MSFLVTILWELLKYVAKKGTKAFSPWYNIAVFQYRFYRTIHRWAKSLPKGLRIQPDIFYINFFSDLEAAEDGNLRPVLNAMMHKIKYTYLPSQEIWLATFMERWSNVKQDQGQNAHPFFLLPRFEAKQHIRSLVEAASREFAKDIDAFKSFTIAFAKRMDSRPTVSISIGEDIYRLREYTKETLRDLSQLAVIEVSKFKVKIQRPCVNTLIDAAGEGHCLVLGEPGSGKSGVLYDAANKLIEKGRDVIFLAADRLDSNSLSGLQEELGLQNPLLRILENWSNPSPGFVLIDALDAARSDASADMLNLLISEVTRIDSRWKVVATIRKFDLRYRPKLQDMFTGSSISFPVPDAEFPNIRHMNTPLLEESELEQIPKQWPELGKLLEDAKQHKDSTLHQLLHLPFNLHLTATLIASGSSIKDFTPVRSQIELLDKYWSYRVIGTNGQGYAREALIQRMCQLMVEAQSLKIDVEKTNPSENSAFIDQLLRNNVLIEYQQSPQITPNRNILAFSHHVLFDYATARMLFRDTGEKVIEMVTEKLHILLSIRPSLRFHFQHLWLKDKTHSYFWDLAIKMIQNELVPKIGQLLAPLVATEMAQSISDFELLFKRLGTTDNEDRAAAEEAASHIVGTLLIGDKALVGETAGPWCEFLAKTSEQISLKAAGHVRPLLMKVTDEPREMTPVQNKQAGLAARHLMKFSLKNPKTKRGLLPVAISSVCKTFTSDAKASDLLIRQFLESEILDEGQIKGIYSLTRNIKFLFHVAPELVESIYLSVLRSPEPEAKETSMSDSQILPLTSNLKQDFDLAQWNLAKAFKKCVEASTHHAIKILTETVKFYVESRHNSSENPRVYDFSFGKQKVSFVADYSYAWDQGGVYQHDPPVMMLDAFSSYLEDLGANESNLDRVQLVIDLIVKYNTTAVVWRRLIRVGAKCPDTIGKQLAPILKAPILLATPDTATEAGNMLRVVHPKLGESQKREIEELIMKFPHLKLLRDFSYREKERDRLLGCIPLESIVTSEAHQHLQTMLNEDSVPSNEPPVRFESSYGAFTEEDYLRRQGVNLEKPANVQFREILRPISEFTGRFLNDIPTLDDAMQIMPAMKSLKRALETAKQDGVQNELINPGVGKLTEVCESLARNDQLLEQKEEISFIRSILLQSSKHPIPEYDSERNKQFDRIASWGRLSPRISAAQGLMLIARNKNTLTPEVREAIERLSQDPVSAVRYMIVQSLGFLQKTDSDFRWRLIDQFANKEPSLVVLDVLVDRILFSLTRDHTDRVVGITKNIFSRVALTEGCVNPQDACTSLLVRVFVHLDHVDAGKTVFDLVQNVTEFPEQLQHMAGVLRNLLADGGDEEPIVQKYAVCLRAWELMDAICESSVSAWTELEEKYGKTPSNQIPKEITQVWQNLARLIDSIARNLHFASGAYQEKKKGGEESEQLLTAPQKRRFFQNAKKSLQALKTVGLASAAHHLIEMLQAYIEINPEEVFLQIAEIVVVAEKGGYQYESLAVDLLVEILGRYMAEYKEIFRVKPNCQKMLVRVLDIFVMWPNARKLTYRLKDIYR